MREVLGITLLVFTLLCPRSFGDDIVQQIVLPVYDKSISEVLPDDLANLKNQLSTDGTRVGAAQSCISIIAKSLTLIGDFNKTAVQRKQAANAYLGAWAVGIRFWSHANDQAAKDLIMGKWNESLVESPGVTYQIAALAEQWNRSFLTDQYWALLKTSSDINTISSICYAIERNGTIADGSSLLSKLKATSDIPTQSILQNGLNWLLTNVKLNTRTNDLFGVFRSLN